MQEEVVPLSIFKTKLSGLESLVVYLKDVKKMSIKEVASILSRKISTIYSSYYNAKSKNVKLLLKSSTHIPLIIFSNRKFSILESLVFYLKNKDDFTLTQISKSINKSQSTIKTVYGRYKKKCLKKIENNRKSVDLTLARNRNSLPKLRARSMGHPHRSISKLVVDLSFREKKKLFASILQEEVVPLSIFETKLSGLKSLVVYLKDVREKSIKEISKALNRERTTIYSTYTNVKHKKPKLNTKSSIHVPLIIFSNRKFSVLESLVSYLKDEQNITLAEISRTLNKSPSTIKTVYWRYKKKCLKK